MLDSKHVVLVDELDQVLGITKKHTAHHRFTALHRGFSVFLFNSRNETLLQKRHASKKTWPNFWSNSFCGHPQLGESYEHAVYRHGLFELNIKLKKIFFACHYRYRFSYNNDHIVEHEICPIYFAEFDDDLVITPNPSEISEIKWLAWPKFLITIQESPAEFTPWSIEETHLLQASVCFKQYVIDKTNNKC